MNVLVAVSCIVCVSLDEVDRDHGRDLVFDERQGALTDDRRLVARVHYMDIDRIRVRAGDCERRIRASMEDGVDMRRESHEQG